MCRTAALVLSPDPTSPGLARRFTADFLTALGLIEVTQSAILLVSELATNATRHAGTRFRVTLAVAEGAVEIGVTDDDPLPGHGDHAEPELTADVRLLDADADAEGGRGLGIVDALADEWGARPLPGGKQVWCRLSADEVWSPEGPCGCAQLADAEGVELGSGRRAADSLAR